MRKRLISSPPAPSPEPEGEWLDLERLATVEVSSEAPDHPIEGALLPRRESGWRAGGPGPQVIRILFDEARRLRRIRLVFEEPEAERTQELFLSWSAEGEQGLREIVRQQWNFSPQGATSEIEDYEVDLPRLRALELQITPDIQGRAVVASLRQLRLA